jgi:hypothetical protein
MTGVAFVVTQGKKELRRATVGVEGDEPPAITFTMSDTDARALREGELDLSVGFMRGQIKMAGDFGELLRFLPLTHGPAPSVPIADVPGL